MASIRTLALSCIACVAAPAGAPWAPLWSGAWEHEPDPHSVAAVGIRVADDGRIFTLLDAGHAGQAHSALARFDEGGVFAWLRERPGSFRMDARLMDGNRIVVVDQFGADVRVRVYDGEGGMAWEDQSQSGLLAAGPRRVAGGAEGGLLMPAGGGGGCSVGRHTAGGPALAAR